MKINFLKLMETQTIKEASQIQIAFKRIQLILKLIILVISNYHLNA